MILMGNSYLLAFVALMVAVAVATLVLLVSRIKRQRAGRFQRKVAPEVPTVLPALVVDVDGQGEWSEIR